MTVGRVALAGALALLVGACGSGSQFGGSSQGGTGNEGGGGFEGGGGGTGGGGALAGCPDGVTLRVAGVDPGAVTSLALSVGGVDAAYEEGGLPISVTGLDASPHDLLAASSSAIGVLHLGAQLWPYARISLTFSGGSAVLGEACGDLDLCTGPLTFHLDPGLVKPDRCHVVVTLDVGRSVAATAGGLVFLPQFRVVY
jgi:hypothetical protein